MSTTRDQVWHHDQRKQISFRLRRLFIGDALVSPTSGWRIYCIADPVDDARLYLIYLDGLELTRRKRPESTVTFLLNQRAPLDLEFQRDGALHMIAPLDDDYIELLGYLPSWETKATVERQRQVDGLWRRMFNWCMRSLRLASPETFRIVIQPGQASWLPEG